jgi:galactan endo-1,6-beta-galactosidase
VLPAAPARADCTTRVDPARDWGRWQGWGASPALRANVFGRDDTLADVLHTTRRVPYQGRLLPGLGLNVMRYEREGSSCFLGVNMENPNLRGIKLPGSVPR